RRGVATPFSRRAVRPRPDAGGVPAAPPCARAARPAFRLAARDGRRRPAAGVAGPRGPGVIPRADWAVEGHGNPHGHGAVRPRGGRGGGVGPAGVRENSPGPGGVKTRLCPPRSASEAARLAEASLRDTLEVAGRAQFERRVIVLDGAPGPWLPAGFVVVP